MGTVVMAIIVTVLIHIEPQIQDTDRLITPVESGFIYLNQLQLTEVPAKLSYVRYENVSVVGFFSKNEKVKKSGTLMVFDDLELSALKRWEGNETFIVATLNNEDFDEWAQEGAFFSVKRLGRKDSTILEYSVQLVKLGEG